jgi:acyl-CoA oxidase
MTSTATLPGMVPFLPLIYVAWADGELTGDELGAFRAAIHRQPGIDAASLAALDRWLDPELPLTAVELEDLLGRIHQHRDAYLRPGSGAALGEVASALGMPYEEVVRELLGAVSDEAPTTAALRVDTAAMQQLLDGPERDARQRMRALLARPEFRYRHTLGTEAYRKQVMEWLQVLAREGFGSRGLPAELGGGADLPGFLAAFETLGTHDQSLTVKFGVQFGLFAGSIHMLGTERHHRWLRDAASGVLPGCFAMSELEHGSNVRDLRTEARFDAATDEFVIHTPDDGARKEWIGNAAVDGRMATVFAQLYTGESCHGVHALLVPLRDASGRPLPGVRIADAGEKMGLNGVDNGSIWFDHVRVPRENLLNRHGDVAAGGHYTSPIASPDARFFTMLGTLVGGRISVARFALSAAKSGQAVAVRYAARRRQFGPGGSAERLLLDYQSHQRRLMPALATTYACDFALKALTRRYLGFMKEAQREIEVQAAGLKAYVTWHVTGTLQQCRECCGGQGFLAANRVGVLKSDTDVYTTFEGDNTVLMQLVAKGLLTEYRQQFGSMRLGGVVRFIASQASRRLVASNPVAARNTDESHLRDVEVQQFLLRYREERMLGSVARRLKRMLDDGEDPFDAFTRCQDHLLHLAHAHVERVVASAFRAGIADAPRTLRPILTDLADLHVLNGLDRDAAWYLATGVMEGNKAKAIRKLVLQLSASIAPAAEGLVDAFGIPDEVLGAPIAL